MRIGRLLLRLVVGGFFFGHGTQKLLGWFGGSGLEGTAEGFEKLGLRPGKVHASAAGVTEAGGGTLLLLGLETPLAAAMLTATMLTAIRTVHGKNGPWASNGGYEYNVVLIAVAIALAEIGPGPLSLDALRGNERAGAGWALAALGAGAFGAVGVQQATARQAPLPAAPQQAAPQAPEGDRPTPGDQPLPQAA
jgi:putative oxidoreductase